jgi:hypothetical protein
MCSLLQLGILLGQVLRQSGKGYEKGHASQVFSIRYSNGEVNNSKMLLLFLIHKKGN